VLFDNENYGKTQWKRPSKKALVVEWSLVTLAEICLSRIEAFDAIPAGRNANEECQYYNLVILKVIMDHIPIVPSEGQNVKESNCPTTMRFTYWNKITTMKKIINRKCEAQQKRHFIANYSFGQQRHLPLIVLWFPAEPRQG